MKIKIEAIIIVEGKSDVAFLESFIDAKFVTTNGSEIPFATIEYLRSWQGKYPLVVLTDPDTPGKRIRDILNQKINNLTHVYIDKEKAIKKNKVGIAEADKEEICKILSNLDIRKDNYTMGTMTLSDLFSLGLAGDNNCAEARQNIANKYQLGYITTAKEFLKRLNMKNISLDDLQKDVKLYACE